MVEEIIKAGILAPSAKNRQPWKFVVAAERAKEGMIAALAAGLERERREPFLAESACHLDGAEYSFSIMKHISSTMQRGTGLSSYFRMLRRSVIA